MGQIDVDIKPSGPDVYIIKQSAVPALDPPLIFMQGCVENADML